MSTPAPRPIVVTSSWSGIIVPVSSTRRYGAATMDLLVVDARDLAPGARAQTVAPELVRGLDGPRLETSPGGQHMADTPSRGLADVVAASTAISDIDGKAGKLFYRGYDIHELGGQISFEECVHLLQRGTLPTQAQLDEITAELAAGRGLGPTVRSVLPLIAGKASPMEALRTLLSASSVDDPDKDSNAPEANARKAVRLVAQMPVLVASYHAARTGNTVPDADPSLGTAGNFLLQITGKTPSPTHAAAFD